MYPYIAPSINPQQVVQYNLSTNKVAIWAISASFLIAPAGVILGFIALAQLKTRPQPGRGLAITGIVLGFFFMALQIGFFILLLVWLSDTSELIQQ